MFFSFEKSLFNSAVEKELQSNSPEQERHELPIELQENTSSEASSDSEDLTKLTKLPTTSFSPDLSNDESLNNIIDSILVKATCVQQ